MRKIVLGVILLNTSCANALFETLSECKNFANTYREDVECDNCSWRDPSYSTFYGSVRVGFFKRLLKKLGIKAGVWDLLELKQPIGRIVQRFNVTKQQRSWTPEITVEEGVNLFVWGDLYGAFHSFLRDLDELAARKVLSEQLKINSKTDYLVVLGNAINYSPYSYPLLTLLLSLIEKNPEHFIYIRGPQETAAHWKDFYVMRKPLVDLGKQQGFDVKGKLPLEDELNTFFGTLPDGVLFRHKKAEDLCCLSHSIISRKLFFDPKVQAALMGKSRIDTYWSNNGLEFSGFEGNAATWSLFSAPVGIYQKAVNFYSDSFVAVHVGKSFAQSTMSLFSRDIRLVENFKEQVFSLSVGMKIDPRKKTQEIPIFSIGSTMPLTGGLMPLGVSVKQGVEAAFRKVNDLGGVDGYFLKLVILDDRYSPGIARANVDLLLKKFGIQTLICPVGTPTLNAYLDLVRAGKVWVFYPITGSEFFRSPDLGNIVNQPYGNDTKALMKFMASTHKFEQYAIVYPRDLYGNLLMEQAQDVLKSYGINDVLLFPVSPKQRDFKEIVKKLKEADPEVLAIFLASGSMASSFLSQLGNAFLGGKNLAALAYLDDANFGPFLHKTGLKFNFSYLLPNPYGSDFAFLRDYREHLKRYDGPIDVNSLEGFLGATCFVEAMKKVGKPFAPSAINDYLTHLNPFPIKGFLTLEKDPLTGKRYLPVSIKNDENEWIMLNNLQEDHDLSKRK